MGMANLAEDFGFAEEPLAMCLACGGIGFDRFQSNQPSRCLPPGEKHSAHPSLAKFFDDLVAGNRLGLTSDPLQVLLRGCVDGARQRRELLGGDNLGRWRLIFGGRPRGPWRWQPIRLGRGGGRSRVADLFLLLNGDANRRLAALDQVAVLEDRLLDSLCVHIGPVPARHVDEQAMGRIDFEHEVVAREVAVEFGLLEVRVCSATDDERIVGVEGVGFAAVRAVGHFEEDLHWAASGLDRSQVGKALSYRSLAARESASEEWSGELAVLACAF